MYYDDSHLWYSDEQGVVLTIVVADKARVALRCDEAELNPQLWACTSDQLANKID